MGVVNAKLLQHLLQDFLPTSPSNNHEENVSNIIYSSDEMSQYYTGQTKNLSTSIHNAFNIIIVLLCPEPPRNDLKILLSASEVLSHRVAYFIGSCKNSEDLQRIQVEKSLAIIILSKIF